MNEKELLKELLKLRGWTQKDLADEVGLSSQSTVSAVLNGRNRNGCRLDRFVLFCEVLGCEVVVRDRMGSGKEWRVKL